MKRIDKLKHIKNLIVYYHAPSDTFKIGATILEADEYVGWDYNRYHDMDLSEDSYQVILCIKTKKCEDIKKQCVKLIANKYGDYKVRNAFGTKMHPTRFYNYEPLIQDVKAIIQKEIPNIVLVQSLETGREYLHDADLHPEPLTKEPL